MKTIWFINHYATNQFLEHSGRHYCFSKYLLRSGYKVRIFCASTVHNTDCSIMEDGRLFEERECDGISFVFVRARPYQGNGKQRVLNMLDFFLNLLRVTGHFEKPDVIIGSSVHPLACVAAIKLGKRYHCRAIAEIRDFWPASIVAYGIRKQTDPVIRLLYRLEKWIYTKADAVIFTMEGGRDYIIEKGWDKAHGGPVDLDKMHYINNGVDLEVFDKNKKSNCFNSFELDDSNLFTVVYTGSIRPANGIDLLVDAGKLLTDNDQIRILIWGAGDSEKELRSRVEKENIMNVIFEGKVPRNTIPAIISKSSVNIHCLDKSCLPLLKYGGSFNKLFEYMAARRPIISTVTTKSSPIVSMKCGFECSETTPQCIAEQIKKMAALSKEQYDFCCLNARKAADDYSFEHLTEKLIRVVEGA